MTEIIGVRFKSGGKMYYFNPNGTHVDVGQHVVIETAKGVEFGECVQSNTMVDEMELVATLRPMLRVATEEDFRQIARNKEREKRAYTVCQEKIQEHGLEMKLVEVKYSFDGSKILFFFTADGRVDFRGLVKDLAAIFHTRIELRQIGVRDEAKMMGGLGICGRPFCCSQFLDDFQPVSIKMAKTQNISLNPTKISGACGRLMCCLKYEQDAYEDLLKHTPKLDSLVKTPDGVGTINQVSLLRQQCKVILDNDPDTTHIYSVEELEVLRNGKGKRPAGYELPQRTDKSASASGTSAKGEAGAEEQSAAAPTQEEKSKRPRRKRTVKAPEEAATGGENGTSKQTRRPKGEGQSPRKSRPPRGNNGEEETARNNGGHRRYRPHHHHRGNGATAPKSESGE